MQFIITIKRGPEIVAQVRGREVNPNEITREDCEQVIRTEQLLERLLGYRVHVDSHV